MNTNWISCWRFAIAASLCLMLATTQTFGQVVINEIDYDQPGNDYFEFIELKNTGVSAVSLDTFYLELYNGGTESVYDLIDLPDSTLAPGEYFVICGDADSVTTCDFATGTSTNLIQNGGPDAVALFHVAPTNTTVPVANNGSIEYVFGGLIANPDVPIRRGETYTVNISAAGHPFWIKTAPTLGQGDLYNNGVTNNGAETGTITFTIPFDAPDTLYYQCEFHAPMGGMLMISNSYSDAVSYDGSVLDANFVEGTGFAGSDPTGASDDFKGISRVPDGSDTDDNDTDFSVRCITPGAANTSDNSNCPNPYQLSICEVPDTVYFQDITNDGLTAYWDAANGSNIGYLIEADVEGFTPVGDYDYVTDTFLVVPSGVGALPPNTTFDLYIREICSTSLGDTSAVSGPFQVTTLSDPCDAPTSLTSSNATTSSATVSWTSAGTNAVSYILEYDTAGFTPGDGDFMTPTDTFANISGLMTNTEYDFYVTQVCGTNPGDTSAIVGPESFTTLCNTFAFPFLEGFESGSASLSCWTQKSVGDGWNLTTAQSNSGTQSYFHNDVSGVQNDTLISPSIDLSAANSPELSFFERGNFVSFYVNHEVSISTDGGNTWSAPIYSQVAPDNTWGEVVIDVSAYAGQTINVGFFYEGDFADEWYIDDVELREAPTCADPSALASQDVTENSATLFWTAGNGAQSFIVEYDTAGFTPGDGNLVATNDTFTLLSSLDGNTEFDFYVSQVCGTNPGDTTSAIGPESFQTLCSTFAFPFFEDFESGSTSLSCWTQNGIGAGWLTTTSRSNSGSQSYFHDDNSGAQADTLFSPSIDLTGSVSPELSFFENGNFVGSTDVHEVLISSDGGATWSLLYSFDATEDTWTEVVLDVSGFAGQTIQVAFYYEGNFSDEWYLDDFELREAPTCADPSALASQDVTENSATLFWTAGNGAQSFIVEYDTAGFTPGDGNLVATNDTFTLLSSLDGNTEFDFYVSQVCGTNPGDTTSAIGPESFKTNCGAFTATYTENFDTTGGVAIPDNGPLPDCWTGIVIDASGSALIEIDVAGDNFGSPTPAISSPNIVEMSTDDIGDTVVLVSPLFSDLGAQDKRIRFYAQRDDHAGDLFIGTMTDANNVNTFVPYDTILNSELQDGTWAEFTVNFDTYTGGAAHIAFMQTEPNAFSDTYLDNFVYEEIPSCQAPTALSSQDITSTSATAFWTAGGINAASYIVEYDTAGFTLGDGNLVTTNDTFSLFSGLDANTSYDFYVTQVCGTNPGDTSIVAGPESFTTACGVITAPYFENFDGTVWVPGTGFSNSGSEIDPCWTSNPPTSSDYYWGVGEGTTGSSFSTGPDGDNTTGIDNYVFTESSNGSTGDTATFTSPQIDLSSLTTPQLLYAYHFHGATIDTFLVSVDDGNGYVFIDTIIGEQQADNPDPWLNRELDLSAFAGATVNVRFTARKGGTSSDYAIDDFWIRETPSCLVPTDLSISNLASTSATASWTPSSGASSYIVEYDTAGFTIGTGNVLTTTDTFLNISGLMTSTSYDLYVTQACSANPGDTSFVVGPVSFTTPCNPFTATYTENFDTTGGVAIPDNGSLPDCWTGIVIDASGTATLEVDAADNSGAPSSPISSPNFIELTTDDTGDTVVLVSPAFSDLGAQDKRIRFYAQRDDHLGDLFIGTMTDPNDVNTFVPYATILNSELQDGVWDEFTVNFDTYIGGTAHIAFMQTEPSAFSDTYLDNFVYEEIPSCQSPTALGSQDVTENSATAFWTAGGTNAQSYIVEYDTAGFTVGTGTVFTTTDTFASLSGLMSATDYDFYVAQVCGTNPGDTSIASGSANFTTSCGVFAFPFLDDLEAGSPSLSCWTLKSAGDGWELTSVRANSGSQSYFHDDISGVQNDTLISPAVDLSTAVNPELSFFENNNFDFAYVSHQVSISTDGGATWSAPIYNQVATEDTWTEVVLDVSAYVGQTINVGFFYEGDFADEWYIDDFELREAPQCPPVSDLTATNITKTDATLSWTSGTGNDTTYIVGYDIEGTSVNALGNIFTTSDTFLNISGLTGSTAYDFYVAGICGTDVGDTTIVGPSTFTTALENDECVDALYLCDTLLNQTNVGATQSLPGCAGTADDDVWYQFIARSTNPQISVDGETGFDAVVELLSGSCGSTTSLVCEDNTFGGGVETINASGLIVGETYYVRVYDWFTGETGEFDIFLQDAPLATTISPQRDTVCIGGTTTFTASGGDTYLWSTGETTTSITTPTVLQLSEYYVTVTDTNGCSSVDTAVADVYPAPAVSAGMNDTICLGDTTTLTATGAGTFLWSTNESTASIDVSPSVTTEYVVTLTGSANGCTNTDTVLVVIDTLPAAVLPDTALVCSGSNVTLDAGNPGSSYSWSTSASTQTITVASTNVGLYTVEITNSQGCVTNDTSLVELTASVPVSLQDYTICEGDTQVLDAGNPGKDFLWSTGETTQTIEVTLAGLYDVTVTDPLAGCSGVDTSIITVNPAPPADAGSDETICEGSDVTLTATGGDSYAWSSGDNTASTTVAPVVTTDYIVTVTENVNNCSATDTVTVNVNPAPLADAGTNDTICVGETSTFTATGGDSYAWSTGSNFDTTIVSPLTTTEYVVTVTENVNNCTATDTVLSVVNPLPNADAGSNDTICLGESSTLTATGGVDYSWSSGDNTASSTVTPTVDTEYRVTVTDANGCVNKDTVDVVVNGLPTADAGSNDTICEGETTTLTASGGVSYNWSSGDNTAATDVSPVVDTEYIVTVTDANGCTDTDTADVFVNAAPLADAGTNDTICVGETSTFTAAGGDSYAWSSGSNFDTTIVSPLTTTEYVVTVTENVNNCTATDTVLSVVNPLPNADAGSNDTICLGESSTLTATGGVDYSWSSGDNTASTTVTPSADAEYIVTVTDANGCVNTDTADVVVNALPVADAGADQTICIGSSATLTAAGGTDYEWSNGDLTASTSVAPASATEYSVTVTDANACSDADTVEVFVNPLPTAEAGVDTNVCEGSSVTLTASGGVDYLWSSGDSSAATSVSPSMDMDYVVTATDANGCSDTDTVSVEVLELPIVRFVQVDSVYCVGVGNVQLVASPPGGTFSGTGVSGTDLDLTAVGSGNTTTVTFTYEALNGCENSTSLDILVDPCTGIDEIDFLNQVQLMPNPFTDRLIMTFNSDKESKVMISMTDVSGKQVYAQEQVVQFGKNTFELSSGAQLAEGMYFITISNADNAMTFKVIKSK